MNIEDNEFEDYSIEIDSTLIGHDLDEYMDERVEEEEYDDGGILYE